MSICYIYVNWLTDIIRQAQAQCKDYNDRGAGTEQQAAEAALTPVTRKRKMHFNFSEHPILFHHEAA